MSLAIFFDPVDEKVYEHISDPQAFYHHISLHTSFSFPEWQEARLALIGITEERGTLFNKGISRGPEEIRKKLYKLNKGSLGSDVVDLGDLRPGMSLEDTYDRLREICSTMMEHNVTVILMGGSHDMCLGQFYAYQDTEKRITVLNVDAWVDMWHDEDDKSRNYLQQIYTHEPNFLFNYIHMGYQSYLVDSSVLNTLEKLYFDLKRLGQVKENIKEAEPTLREADMMAFDIGAIKMTDAPGHVFAQPFGFTGEEACQLCWYAGMNDKLSSVGFYEYNPLHDHREQTAGVVATMIWYFIAGFYNRKNDVDFSTEMFSKYFVTLRKHPHSMVFYKSKLSEKWWIEVPPQREDQSTYLVPCSYKDYTDACDGDVPERWINTYARLI
jgi:formiminoglutamase